MRISRQETYRPACFSANFTSAHNLYEDYFSAAHDDDVGGSGTAATPRDIMEDVTIKVEDD